MQDIQKQPYLKLITSKIYSEDAFCAKGITLDFMYQFDNPCIAMLSLTDILNYDTCIAKISFKCIYGIVLAVEDYFKYIQKIIMYKFIKTLIDGVLYKIADYFLDDYENCMINIMYFIAQNIDFDLLLPFFELIKAFKSLDLNNDKNKKVYEAYCHNLEQVCYRLSSKNKKLFFYRLNNIKSLYESFRNEAKLQNFYKVIDEFSENNQIYIFSNNSCKFADIVTQIKKTVRRKVLTLEKPEIDDLIIKNCQVVFILDFEQENDREMMYYLGKLEEKLSKDETLVAIFYGCSANYVKTNPMIKELIDKYIRGEDLENGSKRIEDFIKN